ncbi:hypothetical protein N875_02585 [Neisseria meningitidis LNP21362]|uniref:Uncharacterized protein n=3 Tax=Neisseria meningitidis TaxID=487 RepID=C6SKP9_NEIME|nr:hypothetical protein N875_02585 [Neisseria meningitidis LNP21362]KID53411.1 hypothetical protein N872_06180 [Neisseria meningitidis LNP27256]CBA05921.1 hypothetical protein predicted by Glimmer/Critica [Neisseria meningitidis alpha153]CBA08425.1 hypothetical protein predicted by Glimmer/Critica [Neisseria meningitidis alpha275]CCA44938.1 hypothetical protein NMALPHA522_1397 [Neisseria meningitidis alpha522]
MPSEKRKEWKVWCKDEFVIKRLAVSQAGAMF